MTRGWPLAVLAFVFVWLVANVSSAVLWGIAIFFAVAMIALMVIMSFHGKYVGPKTLVDDFRIAGRKVMRDAGGEGERAEERRRRYAEENDDFYDDELETEEVVVETVVRSDKGDIR